ncbi:MAG: hypothetical protein ACI9TH_004562 [Kiritimatiellia bacterium]|jgi:hypothetical protein
MKPSHICSYLFAAALLPVSTLFAADAAQAFTASIEQRVRDWQPVKEERLLDQIGWANGLVEGKRLAAEHNRPVFVFTYNGSKTRNQAIALQRC